MSGTNFPDRVEEAKAEQLPRLRGPLRGWAEDLLERQKLDDQGLLDSNRIRQKWSEHLSGRRNWQYHLWSVLMFQAWQAKLMEP